jgi:hypothetical protein
MKNVCLGSYLFVGRAKGTTRLDTYESGFACGHTLGIETVVLLGHFRECLGLGASDQPSRV